VCPVDRSQDFCGVSKKIEIEVPTILVKVTAPRMVWEKLVPVRQEFKSFRSRYPSLCHDEANIGLDKGKVAIGEGANVMDEPSDDGDGEDGETSEE
jgi:hypothetical protein